MRNQINAILNALDRASLEVKSAMNHEGLNPDEMAEVNSVYYDLMRAYEAVEKVDESLRKR